MSITRKDVEHASRLARIELTEEETKRFEHELSKILDFVETLSEADTAHVEPLAGGADRFAVGRADALVNGDLEGKAQDLLRAAPAKRNGFVEVRSVFKK